MRSACSTFSTARSGTANRSFPSVSIGNPLPQHCLHPPLDPRFAVGGNVGGGNVCRRRSPLTKVDDDGIKQRIAKIEKNANDLTEQLNLLRDYFKNEKPQKVKGNVNHIITDLKPYFREIEAGDDITIQLELDSDVPMDLLIPG